MKHTGDVVCPLCSDKIQTAHPYLQAWFQKLKEKYPHVHIAWAYRGPEDQAKAYREGKTRLQFPGSPHNKNPALALDLFTISDEGTAGFPVPFYAQVNRDCEAAKLPILWGGTFQKLKDFDHFEYRPTQA